MSDSMQPLNGWIKVKDVLKDTTEIYVVNSVLAKAKCAVLA